MEETAIEMGESLRDLIPNGTLLPPPNAATGNLTLTLVKKEPNHLPGESRQETEVSYTSRCPRSNRGEEDPISMGGDLKSPFSPLSPPTSLAVDMFVKGRKYC